MEYKKIEVLLTKNNVTTYRMCKDLGLHTSSVTAWRRGDYKPSVTTLKKIADYFGVTVDYFL
jgi:repressor LexA